LAADDRPGALIPNDSIRAVVTRGGWTHECYKTRITEAIAALLLG
jgi:hypothetical protein